MEIMKKNTCFSLYLSPTNKVDGKGTTSKKIKTKIRKKHRLAYNSNTETYLMQISERKKKI